MSPAGAGRRPRPPASEVAAWSLLVLIVVLTVADMPVGYATRWEGSGGGVNPVVFLIGFAPRLKDTVSLDSVRDDLAGVVHQALEPAHVSVWIADRG